MSSPGRLVLEEEASLVEHKPPPHVLLNLVPMRRREKKKEEGNQNVKVRPKFRERRGRGRGVNQRGKKRNVTHGRLG